MTRLACIVLAFAMACGVRGGGSFAANVDEKVFLASVDGQVVVDVNDGELRVRKAGWTSDGNTYLIDGKIYPLDWNRVRDNRKKLDVKRRLSIKADTLYFDGKAVELPRAIKMRNVWDAVLWNGWVLCLGRTSNTDKEAKGTPPFFASELVAFKPIERRAMLHYLSFNPPEETALQILSAKQSPK